MRTDLHRRPRRGAILVQFALLAFAFFAIAALVIDMRIASWTQQQMQVATDSASLEGRRYSDEVGPAAARILTRERMQIAFDDDLDPGNGDEMDYGAGPRIRVRDARPDGTLGVVQIEDERVYDPVLELNLPNKTHGDMVYGDFDETDDAHTENGTYVRTDFTPSASDDASLLASDSFLVRLRRSNIGLVGLESTPGVSSTGGALPLLWGRGALLRADNPDYNPRTEGITVRATSIATSRRALQIATPGPTFGYPALERFGLRSDPDAGVLVAPGQVIRGFTPGQGGTLPPGHGGTPPGQLKPETDLGTGPPGFWENIAVDGTVVLTVRGNGTIRFEDFSVPGGGGGGRGRGRGGGGGSTDYRGGLWGYFAVESGGLTSLRIDTVGQPTSLDDPIQIPEGLGFLPLFRTLDGVEQVIGFGRVVISDYTVESPDPDDDLVDQVVATFSLRKLGGAMVPAGATAISMRGLALLTQSSALRAAHAQFEEPVQAPVLTR